LEVEGSVECNRAVSAASPPLLGSGEGGGDVALWNVSTEVAVDSDLHKSLTEMQRSAIRVAGIVEDALQGLQCC